MHYKQTLKTEWKNECGQKFRENEQGIKFPNKEINPEIQKSGANN
jgi:hypothetical protein